MLLERRARRRPQTYAEQTYGSPHWLVRWPHQRRLRLAAETIASHRPRALLDYGAGDAYVLRELVPRWRPDRIVAFEPVEKYQLQAAETMAALGLNGCGEVAPDMPSGRFDFIVCLGVLEHLPLPQRERFYTLCREQLAPEGRVLIDVPSEVGLSVLIKELSRRALKGRNREFTARELLRVALGRLQFDPARWDATNEATYIELHTGFDHRLLEREIAEHLQLIGSFASPLKRLPAWLGNQEIFFLAERP